MKKIFHKLLVVLASALLTIPIVALAQDYFQATGIPVQRSAMSSAEFRTEFSSIETGLSDKLPSYTGNGDNFVKINVGGTALTSVNNATARIDLGLAIGTNVQAWDEELDEIAALTNTDSNFIVGNGTVWVAEGASTARTSLGLGSLATSSTISNTDWSGTDLAVANGGTGSSTAGDARTALGLAIGSNVQAYDADLAAIAALVNSDSNFIVGNGSAWVAETGATVRSSLGLGSLATVNNISNTDWSGTDLAVANGGTGSSTATNARTALGIVIGTDVQAFDTELAEIAALLNTNNNFLVGTGTVWALESPSSARTSLGLGSLATASTVNNGEWSGTDLAVTNGGTGSSTASDARTALGLVIGTNVQAFASVLANTTASFLSADETKLDGIQALADVTDAAAIAAAGAPIISSGSGSPISTPTTEGNIYIDTTADTSWLATGTASSADWKQASGLGGGDLLAANNLNDVSSASSSRTNLGLAIGTNVQAFDTELLEIAGLANTNNNFMVGTGTVWALETPSAARTSLGLGSLATASTINEGDWSGTDLAVANGGTGSSTAANARTALGVVIGTNVQAHDADLDAIAALSKTDSNFIVGNGSTWVLESASTTRTSLGLGSLATASTVNNSQWSGTDLALVNGGTGSGTASGARTNLGLVIGTDVQDFDSDLTTIAGLTKTDNNFMVANGSAWTSESASSARTSLGLGGLATQGTINNTDWSGTDLAIINGGTGAGTAGAARTSLGLVIGTDVQAFDTELSEIAALANTNNNFIVGTGTVWALESASSARSSLGLGSLATASNIDNGDWSGTDLTIANGGTGSGTASAARTALGLAIGSDVQAHAAVLDSTTAAYTTSLNTKLGGVEALADVTDAANVASAGAPIISSGSGSPISTPATEGDIYVDTTADTSWIATGTASSADWKQASGLGGGDLLAANNLSDVASASTSRTNLGLGSLATLSTINGGNWSGTDLSVANGGTGASTLTGLLKGNGTGAITGSATINGGNWSGTDLSVANGGTGASTLTGLLEGNGTGAITGGATINNTDWSGTDLAIVNGGTGGGTSSAARANLGLAIGTNVQAFDLELLEIAGLANTNNNFIVGTGTVWALESASSARTSLGLGTLATLSSVSNTQWSGTDLSVANGGTGASTLTGLLKGNGTGAITGSATINNGNWSGTDLSVVNGGTGVGTLTGLLFGNGTGAITGGATINNGNWNGTDLAIGNGGTGSSTAAGAATNLGVGTGNSPQFAGVNIGAASDTTITRDSAGKIAVEGRAVLMHDNAALVSGRIFITNVTPSDTSGMATGDFKFVY